ncbi:MAG: hypothetical protein JNK08_12250 [Sediminibacterium sp.]|nr:hypothetical protein [Sediminibacterium sp.]
MTNTEKPKPPLYERRWARIFTYVVYVLVALVTYLLITDDASITWHKALRFYVFSVVWLTTYYSSRPKKTG